MYFYQFENVKVNVNLNSFSRFNYLGLTRSRQRNCLPAGGWASWFFEGTSILLVSSFFIISMLTNYLTFNKILIFKVKFMIFFQTWNSEVNHLIHFNGKKAIFSSKEWDENKTRKRFFKFSNCKGNAIRCNLM